MYGSYERTVSVFQNSNMMAKGLPSAEEVALLEPFRGQLPAEVFGEPYVPPVSDGSGADRAQLRKAAQLLKNAGCNVVNGKRVLPSGEPIAIEFLLDEASFEPHHMPFVRNLGTLGIDASIRLVDPVQFRARRDGFDFDIVIDRFGFSATPGDSLRSFFSSQAAGLKGSNNLAGISEPAVDALIDASWPPRRGLSSPPPAGRSIASFAPAVTGYRSGIKRPTGSPIGTFSGARRRSRATSAAFRTPGGLTPIRH